MAHKQKLLNDLVYTSVEEVLSKKEPITRLTKVDPEKLLAVYYENGYIDSKNDLVTIPKGTILTWKKTIEPDLYDIYYVQGKRTCYIAVAPRDVPTLFGNEAYREECENK